MTKSKKIVRKPAGEKLWTIYTSGGEEMAQVHYRKEEISKLFPDATIKGTKVYL